MHIIIGGTHGLGREIALGLQASGEETYVTGRSYNEAEHGPGMAVDLTDIEQAHELTNCIRDLGDTALSGFFWVAGYGYNGDFATQEKPEDMALANFANVMPIAQAAWQKMSAQKNPSNYVVVSSTTGVRARKDEAVYAGTKHAQVGFTRSLGQESERLGAPIRVALFEPGGMQTPFWDKHRPGAYDTYLDPKKVADHILNQIAEQTDPFYEEMIEKGSL